MQVKADSCVYCSILLLCIEGLWTCFDGRQLRKSFSRSRSASPAGTPPLPIFTPLPPPPSLASPPQIVTSSGVTVSTDLFLDWRQLHRWKWEVRLGRPGLHFCCVRRTCEAVVDVHKPSIHSKWSCYYNYEMLQELGESLALFRGTKLTLLSSRREQQRVKGVPHQFQCWARSSEELSLTPILNINSIESLAVVCGKMVLILFVAHF